MEGTEDESCLGKWYNWTAQATPTGKSPHCYHPQVDGCLSRQNLLAYQETVFLPKHFGNHRILTRHFIGDHMFHFIS